MWPLKNDFNKWLITLAVIKLSGSHCTKKMQQYSENACWKARCKDHFKEPLKNLEFKKNIECNFYESIFLSSSLFEPHLINILKTFGGCSKHQIAKSQAKYAFRCESEKGRKKFGGKWSNEYSMKKVFFVWVEKNILVRQKSKQTRNKTNRRWARERGVEYVKVKTS